MKNHKFQQIRVPVLTEGTTRFDAETDKDYARIKGIFVLLNEGLVLSGTTLGLTVNKQEIFDERHDVRMITCGQEVPPNDKFFLFEEEIEALGSSIEGKVTPPILSAFQPFEVVLYLWLTNDALK